MARSTVLGNDLIIYIDTITSLNARPTDDTNYKAVACLTTNGMELSTEDIDTTSKCSGRFKESDSGDVSWSFSGDGNAIDDTQVAEVNYQTLIDLAISGEKFWVKTANPSNEIIREGIARISSYSETYDRNTPFTFSATFQGSGELYTIQLT